MNSRLNTRLAISHLQLHETPFLGVHETGSRPEEDSENKPGVLIDSLTKSVRVYRCIGREFWAFIGQPDAPETTQFVFLEVLLALSKALGSGISEAKIETRINAKLAQLATALAKLQFPRNSLPEWVRDDFTEDQLFWFATAMTAFYDEGI